MLIVPFFTLLEIALIFLKNWKIVFCIFNNGGVRHGFRREAVYTDIGP